MQVYLDNSATTKPFKEVVDEMIIALTDSFGNPSSSHKKGILAESKLKDARKTASNFLGCNENEIFFTSGGTESNNTAIFGIAKSNQRFGKHIISTPIEHPCVLNILTQLEKDGFEISFVKVNSDGIIDLNHFKSLIRKDTILACVMHVNNEIGSIQPLGEIGSFLKTLDQKIYFFVDAVQSFGKIYISPSKLGIDLLSCSSHKIHGPKGCGLLYVKNSTKIKPFILGGGQERGFRGGTENIPGISGFAKAISISSNNLKDNYEKVSKLKSYFQSKLIENIPNLKFNSNSNSIAHILNVSFLGIRSEILLNALSTKEIYVSIGSACSSKKKGSHVLNAINLSKKEIDSAVRFSFSSENTFEELDYVIHCLVEEVSMIRKFTK